MKIVTTKKELFSFAIAGCVKFEQTDLPAGFGDYTPQGDFAIPVQMTYLVKNGCFVGKPPPLQLNSTFLAIFGKDFIGVSKNPIVPLNPEYAIVMNFTVKKI